MATLTDRRNLSESFSPTAAFLARFIDSVKLQQRWQITRGTLRNYERRGVLSEPHIAFGRRWYDISEIDRLESTLFGLRPAGNEVDDAH